jgi:hypothetical protein
MTGDKEREPLNPIEQEMAELAAKYQVPEDARRSLDDIRWELNARRHETTLADLAETLSMIDDNLSHIKHNTAQQEQVEFRLIAIEKNTKATMETAKAINGNMFALAIMAAFWSAFILWDRAGDIHAFFSSIAGRLLPH